MTNTGNTKALPIAALSAEVGGNPANRYSEESALLAFDPNCDNLDYVRHVALILSVCLGCGTTIQAPDAVSWGAFKNVIDFDAIDCCPDADRVNY